MTQNKYKNMFKRLLISFFAVVIVFFSIAPAAANAQWYNQNPAEWYSQVYDDDNPSEIFGERYTAAQVDWIIMSILTWPATKILQPNNVSCFLNLVIEHTVSVNTCVNGLNDSINILRKALTLPTISDSEINVNTRNQSLAGKIFQERPFSGITYVKNKVQNFSLIPTVEAQTGFGYSRFEGVTLIVWKEIRDMSYALFVVVAIVLSFMIMFRVKTSPQTVMTVQSALPKIAIALVLVTFSYAIAGFMVDMMYVFIGIISIFLDPILPNDITNLFSESTFELLTEGFAGTGVYGFLFFNLYAIPFTLMIALIALPTGALGNFLFLGGSVLIPLALIIMLITYVILWISLIVMFFKITWMLLKTTAMILMLVMFSPLYIVAGIVIPGLGFSSWLKSLAAQLAVFPVVGLLFAFSYLFLAHAFSEAIKKIALLEAVEAAGIDVVPLFGNLNDAGMGFGDGWPPLVGLMGGDFGAILLLGVSIIFLFMVPKAADLIKGFVSGRPISYGTAVGEAVAPAKLAGLGGLQYLATGEESSYAAAAAAGDTGRAREIVHGIAQTARRFKIVR